MLLPRTGIVDIDGVTSFVGATVVVCGSPVLEMGQFISKLGVITVAVCQDETVLSTLPWHQHSKERPSSERRGNRGSANAGEE